MKTINTSEIRFADFSDEWEEKTLKSFRDENEKYSFTGGPFGSDLQSVDYTSCGVRIIQLQNIGDNYFNDQYKIYTSEKKAESLATNFIYPNEIIIAKMADPLARAAILPQIESKYLMASDGIRLKVNTDIFNLYFILTLINHPTFRKAAYENSTGTTRKRIGLVTLGNLKSYLPTFEEQTKIGNFFKAIDESIALHEQELEKLRVSKQGFLQKMFPKEGERVPAIRFAGFDGDWEEKKLGDVCSVAMCKRIFKEQTTSLGDIPFYKIGTFGGQPDSFISKELYDEYRKKYPYPDKGDILISVSGTIGRIVVYNNELAYFQDSNIVWLKQNEHKLSNIFLKQFYAIVRWEGIEGSTIKRLYNNIILSTKIKFPTLQEQTKIGEFFKQLDELIALKEAEIEKLKQTKKAFLQKMFV